MAHAVAAGALTGGRAAPAGDYAELACNHDRDAAPEHTASGQACGRDSGLNLSPRHAGGACHWFGEAFKHGELGFAKDAERSERLLRIAAAIRADEDRDALQRSRDRWNFDLGVCTIGTGVTAMSCASQICPTHCSDAACLQACVDDASNTLLR